MSDEHTPTATAFGHSRSTEGATAADAGTKLADNPHLPGTADFAQWMEGWCNRAAVGDGALR